MEDNALPANSKGGTRATLGLAGLVLFITLVFSYTELQRHNRAIVRSTESRELVDSVDQLLSTLVDAETAQRGFVLTGEDRFHGPYNQAVGSIRGELTSLRKRLSA